MAFSQQKGIVTGTVVDASLNNETMPAVSVAVQGTKLGANTDIDGKFKLELDPGTHVLIFSYIGYKTLRDTIQLKADATINLNVAMTSDAQMLDDVVITGEVRKDTESALLRNQMNSAVTTQSIGAQEMGRKGISNAAVALTKVTGIAKQEGTAGVFVRGLGDRYNITLLNGLPLPSNEPTSKNISLDLFGSDIIQSIGISKIYTANSYGDVGGATVDISSKEHVGRKMLTVGIGSGINTGAFRSDFKRADNWNRSGFYNIKTPTTRTEYTFGSRWTPESINKPFNYDFNIAAGDRFMIGKEGVLSAFATVSHSNEYSYRSGSERVMGSTSNNVLVDYFDVQKYGIHTNSTALANLAYRVNANNVFRLNSTFINGTSSEVGEYNLLPQNQDVNFFRQTTTEQNKLFLNQLLGENRFNERLDLNWGISYGTVNADMPDRITNTLIENNGSGYIYNNGIPTANNRYFQYINEKEWAGRANLNYRVLKNAVSGEYDGKLSVGYTGKIKKRDFEATQFNFRMNSPTGISADPNDIDAFLNAGNLSENTTPGTFTIRTARASISLLPFTYEVKQNVHGGYAIFEHSPNKQLTYTVGLRADKILQEMTWSTNIDLPAVDFDDAKIDKLFIIPEATLKYALTGNENIRVSASRSYTLPQFLEKAPFRFEAPTATIIGNAFVNPSDNYNLDLKWEKFPSSDEVLSFDVFGKYLRNPISQTLINIASSNTFSFVNAGDYAYVIGAELEARKALSSDFSGGVNLTYMYTRQELDADKVTRDTEGSTSVSFNADHDRLQGASPLLVNADITYKSSKGYVQPMFALVGNYFYDRIFSLGTQGRGNIVEKGYPTLNFVSSALINNRWEVGLKVNNLLNNRIRKEQENEDAAVEVYSYKRGLDFSIGLKYNFFN